MADFSLIRKEECREIRIPKGCELNGSHTVVLQSVINEIKEHGRSSMLAEVCGVLVGSLCWDREPYLLIDGRIEGKHASHQSGSVTFTSETWDFIHEELAAKHPDRKIVGWYHTHPGFGIFLSNMDAFIHENFFSLPWEPAYVFDPQAETDGFFFKAGTELVREEVSVSADVAPSIKEPSIAFAISDRIVVDDSPERRYVPLAIIAVALFGCIAAIVTLSLEKIRGVERIVSLEKAVQESEEQISKRNAEIDRLRDELAAARKPKQKRQSELCTKESAQNGEEANESSPCAVQEDESADAKEQPWYYSWIIVIKRWPWPFQSKGEK